MHTCLKLSKDDICLQKKLEENSSEMLDETISQDSKRFQTKYFIAGKEICSLAWSKIFFNITENFDKNAKKNLYR